MEFSVFFAIGITLTSGFVTWTFTYKLAYRKGFDNGYEIGHRDALNAVTDGKHLVERVRNKVEEGAYGVLTSEEVG